MSEMMRFDEAINLALRNSLLQDEKLIVSGLGINDPGRFFGTTKGLLEEFGVGRVFESPTSENALAGVAVGVSLGGYKMIHMHQRADFFYLAFDQLVNSAAKWEFSFGDVFDVPVVFRLVLGRGWGQGPTHAQNPKGMLMQIPGIEVVEPFDPQSAYHLLTNSVRKRKPVVFLEHRWLHGLKGEVSLDMDSDGEVDFRKLASGNDVLLVASGYSVSIAMKAIEHMKSLGISGQLIAVQKFNLETASKIAIEAKGFSRIIIAEESHEIGSFASHLRGVLLSQAEENTREVVLVTKPHYPEPTAKSLLDGYYPSVPRLLNAYFKMAGIEDYLSDNPVDQPPDFSILNF